MLKQRAFFATIWSAADVLTRQGLQLLVTIALARLLSPGEFGTVALLTLFIGISATLVDSGFSSALIQKQNTTHIEESTVFWFNLVTSILVAALLCLGAPHIADFYKQPVLTNIIYVISLIIVFNASGTVHTALLTKRLEFRTQLKIGAVTNIVAGAAAIVLAWKGYGVWALVTQIVTTSILSNLMLWAFCPWRPRFDFELASARSLFGFGGYMLAASLLDTLHSKGYSLIIGKLYSPKEVGLYSQAENVRQFPTSLVSAILLRVAFPMLSAISKDKEKLQRAAQLCMRSFMLLNIPMMLGLATVAETLVEAVFGPQWLPAVPVLQILCLGGILWPMHVININVLLAQGHSRLIFNLQIFKSILGIALLIGGSRYGLIGIAWSQVILSCAAFLLNTHYTKTFLGYGAAKQLLDSLPAFLACLPMIFLVHMIDTYWQAAPAIKLSGLIVVGASSFAAICYFLRLAAVTDILSLFSSKPTPAIEAHVGETKF